IRPNATRKVMGMLRVNCRGRSQLAQSSPNGYNGLSPMARKRFTFRKTLVLAAAVLAVGTIVWWANRGPREPVFEGRKLSWWLTEGSSQGGRSLTKEEILSLGPEGIQWLGYKATETSIWDFYGRPGAGSRLTDL